MKATRTFLGVSIGVWISIAATLLSVGGGIWSIRGQIDDLIATNNIHNALTDQRIAAVEGRQNATDAANARMEQQFSNIKSGIAFIAGKIGINLPGLRGEVAQPDRPPG